EKNYDISEIKYKHKESLKNLMYQNYDLFQIPDFLYYYDTFLKNGFKIDLNHREYNFLTLRDMIAISHDFASKSSGYIFQTDNEDNLEGTSNMQLHSDETFFNWAQEVFNVVDGLTPEKANLIAEKIKLENVFETRKCMNKPLTKIEMQWLCIIIGRHLKFNINKIYFRVLEDPYFIFKVLYYLAITIVAVLEDSSYLDIDKVEKELIKEVETLPEDVSVIDHSKASIDKSIFVKDNIVTFDQFIRYRIESLEQFINCFENQEKIPISRLREEQNNYQSHIKFLENQIKDLEARNHEKEINLDEKINIKIKELIQLDNKKDKKTKELIQLENKKDKKTKELIQLNIEIGNKKKELIELNEEFDLTKKNLKISKSAMKINEYHVENDIIRESTENYDFELAVKEIRNEIDIKIDSLNQKIQVNVLEMKKIINDQNTRWFKEFYKDFNLLNKKVQNIDLEIHKIKNQQKYIILTLIGLYFDLYLQI
ncbi:7961_t:CDS:2, partial [Dentiscutata heterogama]